MGGSDRDSCDGSDQSSTVGGGCNGGDSSNTETDLDADMRAALASTPQNLPTHRPSQCGALKPFALLIYHMCIVAIGSRKAGNTTSKKYVQANVTSTRCFICTFCNIAFKKKGTNHFFPFQHLTPHPHHLPDGYHVAHSPANRPFFFAPAPTLRLLHRIANSAAQQRKASTHVKVTSCSKGTGKDDEATKGKSEGRKRQKCTSTMGSDIKKAAHQSPRKKVSPPSRSRKRPRSLPGSDDAVNDFINPFIAYSRQPSPLQQAQITRRNMRQREDIEKSAFGGVLYETDGVDISENGEEGSGCIAQTPFNARGDPEASQGIYGSILSPLLVDLRSAEEEISSNGAVAEREDLCEVETLGVVEPELPRLFQDTPARGMEGRADALALYPVLSPGHGSDSENVKKRGGNCEGEENGPDTGGHMERDNNELSFASKLFFLVSLNTGRVHVYKEKGKGDDVDDFGDTLGEEEKTLQHCRSIVCTVRIQEYHYCFCLRSGALHLGFARPQFVIPRSTMG